jgi:hypothetical protein
LWVATTQSVSEKTRKKAFVWEAASVYFLMTDRFNNGINQMIPISTELIRENYVV